MRKTYILTTLLCCTFLSVSAQKRLDVAEVHFPVNSYVLNPTFRDNATSLVEISEMFNDEKFMKRVDRISIYATASPEGPAKVNFDLSKARAESLRRYIMWNHEGVISDNIDVRSYPATWQDMAMYVQSDKNFPVRDEVLWLLSDKNKVTDDVLEQQLKSLLLGDLWEYIRSETLLFLRTSWVAISMKPEIAVGNGLPVTIKSEYAPILPFDASALAAPYKEIPEEDDTLKRFALKTNVLYGAVAFAPNLAFEFGLTDKTTLDVAFGYNWFNRKGRPGDNKKRVHWLIEPEFRYFFKERFNGHFVGVHTLFSQFNISEYEMPYLFGRNSKDYRLEGIAFGGGISYGYQYQVNKWFAVEGTIGVGYARILYDLYEHPRCGMLVERGRSTNYFGPTRAGLSLIFYLK